MLAEEQIEERYWLLGREVAAHVGIRLTIPQMVDVKETMTIFTALGIVLERSEEQIQEDLASSIRYVHRENPSILREYFGDAS